MQSVRLLGLLIGLQSGAMPSIASSAVTTATTFSIAGRLDPRSVLAGGDSIPCVPASGNLDAASGSALRVAADRRVRPRWSLATSNVLRVKIMDAPMIAGWNSTYRDEVISGLRAWDSMNSPVTFQLVADSETADITVRWVDHFNANYDGWTTLTWEPPGRIVAGDVALAVRGPKDESLSPLQRDQVMLHEIGHVLGLSHNSTRASIMRGNIGVAAVAPEDIQALRDLYAAQDYSAAAFPDTTAAGKARRCSVIR